jgi:hypothetical protein
MAMVGTAVRSMANRFRGSWHGAPFSVPCGKNQKITFLRRKKLPSMNCTIEFVKFNKLETCDINIKSTKYR